MENKELRSCPFCGSADVVDSMIHTDADAAVGIGPTFWVECLSCGATVQPFGTRKGAIEAWNRRTPDVNEDLLAACEAASRLLNKMSDWGLDRYEGMYGEIWDQVDAAIAKTKWQRGSDKRGR